MSNDRENNDYEVGYGKPPKHSRFKPGESGNRRGRPKKRPTYDDDLAEVFNEKVPVMKNGKKRYVTKRRLILEQAANEAIATKSTATLRLVLPLLGKADGKPEFEVLPEDDEALMQLLRNIQNKKEEES